MTRANSSRCRSIPTPPSLGFQAVQTVKDSMEALERFYRKYDSDSSGYLSQTEVETSPSLEGGHSLPRGI